MAQIKIEITYDPSKETLERAVSSLTAKGTPSNAPAFDTECAVKAAIAAQRFIAANEVDSYVNYLREIAGMTDDQIAAVCGEYVSANSTLLQAAAAGEVKTEGAGPTPAATDETAASAKTGDQAAKTSASGKPGASPSEGDGKKVSKTDVRAAATVLSKAGKREELSAIFAKFGGKKLSDIKEEDYPALMKELEAANG